MYSDHDPLTRGFPHSDIHGSKPARGSPWLFAACHVLHRLLVPRHPPNALLSFNFQISPQTGMIEQTRSATHHAQEPFIRFVIPKSSKPAAARNDNQFQFNSWRQNPMMYDCAGRSFIMLLNTRNSCNLW